MRQSALTPSAPVFAQRYLAAVLDGRVPAASAVVEDALAARHPWATVASEVIEPALRAVGNLWELGEASIAQEHMASEITTAVIGRYAPFGAPVRGRASAVVACPGGETHVLGARCAAGALSHRGWDVTFLGAATPPRGLAALVAARRPTVVVLSTKLSQHLEATREAIARIKALPEPPVIVAGGDAVAACRADLGADLCAADLDAFLATMDRLSQ